MAAFSLITACGQQTATAPDVPKEPPFPTFTNAQLLDLSKGERQELERRCLGVSNKTCDEFKSDDFKKQDAFRKSMCDTKDAMDKMTGGRRDAECEKYH